MTERVYDLEIISPVNLLDVDWRLLYCMEKHKALNQEMTLFTK
jgi:hypothetical protein